MELLARTLSALSVGPPRRHGGLTMYPLLGGSAGDADYHTLDEALHAGTARVTEVSESGNVPELRFENQGEWAVLLLDGEELIGAKQNRVLNLSILAPAGKHLTIPVSCVEAGRWARTSATFGAASHAQYAEVRAKKAASVSASMRSTDQHEVWQEISAKAARMAAPSATSAMAAVFAGHSDTLGHFVEALGPVEGQCGALFTIQEQPVGVDLFDYQATLRTLLPKLVRSYALDAIDAEQAGQPSPGGAPNPVRWLESIPEAEATVFPAVGEGEDVRLSGPRLSGGALVARGRVVHLSAFRLTQEQRSEHVAPRAGLMSRPSARAAR
ncbi:MAG: hypothetical protein FJX77_01115 [Armatimonadetes bacterium]|nr:hypothetical protein [Armatimonadota bacterium]